MIVSSLMGVGRQYIIQAIERWGTPFSIALLDPACLIFKLAEYEGIIGYRKIGSCIVVFGDPVCSPEELPHLMQAFRSYCATQTSNIIYISSSEAFTAIALQCQYVRASVQLCHELVLNPMEDPTMRKGKKASLLRNKYNQSIKQGLVIKEYLGDDFKVEKAMEHIVTEWMNARKGPQIYLFSGTLFTDRENKRWFYAEHNNVIVGLAMLNRIGTQSGWVLNIVIVKADALSTTSEFMMLSILEKLRAEECTYFSIGPSPAEHLVKIQGFNKFAELIARSAYIMGCKIFRLSNRQRYWEKFHPQKKPSFVLFDKPRVGLKELLGIMRALNIKI